MNIRKECILREIAGEYILVPVGPSALDHSGLYVLSEVAKRIWELLLEAEEPENIVRTLLEEYDADEKTLRDDVAAFLTDLQELGIAE